MDKTIYKQTNSIRHGKNWILIVSSILLFYACLPSGPTTRILFVGDILLSRNVQEEYNSRNTNPWETLDSLFRTADLVIGNLEGAVGNPANQINSPSEPPVFAIDSADIQLLAAAGFHAVTLENNHNLDLGLSGKSSTQKALANNHVRCISLDNSPYFFPTKDIICSLIAINLIPNRDGTCHEIPSLEILQKLRLAKSLSDFVIVSIHWGSELLEWPNTFQREAAKWLIANGADLIIGHHPHVIQKPELIDGKPVYFSLGNHLFDQKYPSTKVGLIAEIEIQHGYMNCKEIKTITPKNSFFPVIRETSKQLFESIKINRQRLTIQDIQLIPESIGSEGKMIFNAYRNKQLLWKSHPMPLRAAQLITIGDNQSHLFTLESHFSSIDQEINVRPYVYHINSEGITARWRGSALAWPLLDAQVLAEAPHILCALHRGDAFISPGVNKSNLHTAAYTWNGFGFNMINDSASCKACDELYNLP